MTAGNSGETLTLYGIHNCDTVKKARRWLEQHQVNYRFHDLRLDGLDENLVGQWQQSIALEDLLNRRSTTWKNLDGPLRENLRQQDIPALLVAHPTLVKRPVLERRGLETRGKSLAGFSDSSYRTFFDLSFSGDSE